MDKAKVFVERESGALKPMELPADLAQRAAVYIELRALNLTLEEIRFLWQAQLGR